MHNIEAYESQEQQALFSWAECMSARYPELKLMYHIPNGGKRDKLTAYKLKAQGVKPGVPDICLPVASGIWHGLYIELKRKNGGEASENQNIYIDSLNRGGYYAVICHGWESAASVIGAYISVAHSR